MSEKKKLKVIIPVAGYGTRLRPHTLTQAKVLINVAGKPMISFIVEDIIKTKIADEIILITGIFGDKIATYLTDNYKANFTFIEQTEALGLGHAIYCARENIRKKDNVLIILGDTLFDVNLKAIAQSKYSLIGIKRVDNPKRFGVVETNSNGFITRMVEKPESEEVSPSKDAIVGIYLIRNPLLLFNSLEHIIANGIQTKSEFQLTDALQLMLDNGEKMKTFKVDGWLDCGKIETLLSTNEYLLKKHNNKYIIKTCKIIPPVYIAHTAKITGSIIGPNVTICDGVVVTNSKISHTIIHNNSVIENSNLSQSLLGYQTRITKFSGTINLGDYSEITGSE
ncbi:MAG: sugar phosphate nucleotidyltransferase [Ignavibacteria bacterium]